MLVATTNDLPGYRIVRHVGLVRGITVRSRSVVGNIGGAVQSLFGGSLSIYTNLAETARHEAYELMVAHAREHGANAVIAMRYDANEIMEGITEVLAYGTAVVVEPIQDVDEVWTHHGKVRARQDGAGLVVVVDGLTSQAKYYKPLIYEFFRKAWRGSRPAWGDFSVEIDMEFTGDPPWLDLDNLAKAILDAIKGYVFHDDAQVCRLLVQRLPGERERIEVRIQPMGRP